MTTKSAIVTGGASGLGAATAERLRAEGLTVTTLDLAGADVSVTHRRRSTAAVGRAGRSRRRPGQFRRHRRPE